MPAANKANIANIRIAHDRFLLRRYTASPGRLRFKTLAHPEKVPEQTLYCTFSILALSITFFHFSVSATIILPNASGGPISGVAAEIDQASP